MKKKQKQIRRIKKINESMLVKFDVMDALINIVKDETWDFSTAQFLLNSVLDRFGEAEVQTWCTPGVWNIFETERRAKLMTLTTLRLCMPWEIYALLRQWEPDETDKEYGWEYLRTTLIALLTKNEPIKDKRLIFPLRADR